MIFPAKIVDQRGRACLAGILFGCVLLFEDWLSFFFFLFFFFVFFLFFFFFLVHCVLKDSEVFYGKRGFQINCKFSIKLLDLGLVNLS